MGSYFTDTPKYVVSLTGGFISQGFILGEIKIEIGDNSTRLAKIADFETYCRMQSAPDRGVTFGKLDCVIRS